MPSESLRATAAPRTAAHPQSVSVIGAGVMGCSIAALNIHNGIPVRLADSNHDALQIAITSLTRLAQSRHDVPPPHFCKTRATGPLLRACVDLEELAQSDLVVEAVAERLENKRQLLSSLAPHLQSHTIVASNTSSIPLKRMADCLPDRERFCGLHFCHPVEKRALVEVIRGPDTSESTVATATTYALKLGKRPVVVKDRPGFVVNRILVPYLNEALELILEGADIDALDRVAVAFGMPVGPLHFLDDIGIDVAVRTGMVACLAFPDRVVASRLLVAMYKANQLGRKTGGGFFSADADDNRLTPVAADLIAGHSRDSRQFSDEELTRRLFLPPLLEATRILEEGLVDDPSDVDVALRDGLEFRPPAGGLWRWADDVGAATLLKWLAPLQELGARFEPTEVVRSAAAKNCRLTGR